MGISESCFRKTFVFVSRKRNVLWLAVSIFFPRCNTTAAIMARRGLNSLENAHFEKTGSVCQEVNEHRFNSSLLSNLFLDDAL